MRVAVVGAGITGLAAAWFLRRAGHDVVVLEQAERAGGVVATHHRDGFVLEQGPAAIRGGAAAVAELVTGLGLADRVLLASADAVRRFLLVRGRVVAVPRSVAGVLASPLLTLRGRTRLLAEPFVRGPAHRDDHETVAAFVARRLGPEAADVLLDPVVGGITGGDPATLDVASTFASLVESELRYGSVFAGAVRRPSVAPRGSFSFPRGLEEIVDALVHTLDRVVHTVSPVDRIEVRDEGLRVHASGETFHVEHVVWTGDPETLATALAAFRPPALPRAPVAAVALGYRAEVVPRGLRGFGWLVHSRERRDVLGCQWLSGVFPSHAPRGHHLLRVMVGGTRAPELVDRTDAGLVDHAVEILREIQGIRADPVLTDVVRSVPGIPQYPPGWKRFLASAPLPRGLTLVGWHYTGVGLADGITAANAALTAVR